MVHHHFAARCSLFAFGRRTPIRLLGHLHPRFSDAQPDGLIPRINRLFRLFATLLGPLAALVWRTQGSLRSSSLTIA
jgi:hypothetical protein